MADRDRRNQPDQFSGQPEICVDPRNSCRNIVIIHRQGCAEKNVYSFDAQGVRSRHELNSLQLKLRYLYS